MLWSQSTVSENGEPPDTGTMRSGLLEFQKDQTQNARRPVVITTASGAVIFETGMAVDATALPMLTLRTTGTGSAANARGGHQWVALRPTSTPSRTEAGPIPGYYVSIERCPSQLSEGMHDRFAIHSCLLTQLRSEVET